MKGLGRGSCRITLDTSDRGIMDAIDRLLLVSFRVTGLWALGTRFEPLATGRPRILPANDAEVRPALLADIERHLVEVGNGCRKWLLWGVVLIVFAWIGTLGVRFWTSALMLRVLAARGVPFEQYAAYRDGVYLIWLLSACALWLIWLAWIVVFIRRSQVDPSYEASDRLALALKRGSLSPDSLTVLRSHRPAATTLAYFGKLWPH